VASALENKMLSFLAMVQSARLSSIWTPLRRLLQSRDAKGGEGILRGTQEGERIESKAKAPVPFENQ